MMSSTNKTIDPTNKVKGRSFSNQLRVDPPKCPLPNTKSSKKKTTTFDKRELSAKDWESGNFARNMDRRNGNASRGASRDRTQSRDRFKNNSDYRGYNPERDRSRFMPPPPWSVRAKPWHNNSFEPQNCMKYPPRHAFHTPQSPDQTQCWNPDMPPPMFTDFRRFPAPNQKYRPTPGDNVLEKGENLISHLEQQRKYVTNERERGRSKEVKQSQNEYVRRYNRSQSGGQRDDSPDRKSGPDSGQGTKSNSSKLNTSFSGSESLKSTPRLSEGTRSLLRNTTTKTQQVTSTSTGLSERDFSPTRFKTVDKAKVEFVKHNTEPMSRASIAKLINAPRSHKDKQRMASLVKQAKPKTIRPKLNVHKVPEVGTTGVDSILACEAEDSLDFIDLPESLRIKVENLLENGPDTTSIPFTIQSSPVKGPSPKRPRKDKFPTIATIMKQPEFFYETESLNTSEDFSEHPAPASPVYEYEASVITMKGMKREPGWDNGSVVSDVTSCADTEVVCRPFDELVDSVTSDPQLDAILEPSVATVSIPELSSVFKELKSAVVSIPMPQSPPRHVVTHEREGEALEVVPCVQSNSESSAVTTRTVVEPEDTVGDTEDANSYSFKIESQSDHIPMSCINPDPFPDSESHCLHPLEVVSDAMATARAHMENMADDLLMLHNSILYPAQNVDTVNLVLDITEKEEHLSNELKAYDSHAEQLDKLVFDMRTILDRLGELRNEVKNDGEVLRRRRLEVLRDAVSKKNDGSRHEVTSSSNVEEVLILDTVRSNSTLDTPRSETNAPTLSYNTGDQILSAEQSETCSSVTNVHRSNLEGVDDASRCSSASDSSIPSMQYVGSVSMQDLQNVKWLDGNFHVMEDFPTSIVLNDDDKNPPVIDPSKLDIDSQPLSYRFACGQTRKSKTSKNRLRKSPTILIPVIPCKSRRRLKQLKNTDGKFIKIDKRPKKHRRTLQLSAGKPVAFDFKVPLPKTSITDHETLVNSLQSPLYLSPKRQLQSPNDTAGDLSIDDDTLESNGDPITLQQLKDSLLDAVGKTEKNIQSDNLKPRLVESVEADFKDRLLDSLNTDKETLVEDTVPLLVSSTAIDREISMKLKECSVVLEQISESKKRWQENQEKNLQEEKRAQRKKKKREEEAKKLDEIRQAEERENHRKLEELKKSNDSLSQSESRTKPPRRFRNGKVQKYRKDRKKVYKSVSHIVDSDSETDTETCVSSVSTDSVKFPSDSRKQKLREMGIILSASELEEFCKDGHQLTENESEIASAFTVSMETLTEDLLDTPRTNFDSSSHTPRTEDLLHTPRLIDSGSDYPTPRTIDLLDTPRTEDLGPTPRLSELSETTRTDNSDVISPITIEDDDDAYSSCLESIDQDDGAFKRPETTSKNVLSNRRHDFPNVVKTETKQAVFYEKHEIALSKEFIPNSDSDSQLPEGKVQNRVQDLLKHNWAVKLEEVEKEEIKSEVGSYSLPSTQTTPLTTPRFNQTRQKFLGHNSAVTTLALHNGYLYTCSPNEALIRKFSSKTLECEYVFTGHDRVYALLTLDYNGKSLMYTGGYHSLLVKYDLSTNECLSSDTLPAIIRCLASRWDKVFIGLDSGQVIVLNLDTNVQKYLISQGRSVSCLGTASEGPRQILVVGSFDTLISIHDANNGILLRTIASHVKVPLCVKVHMNSVYSAGADKRVLLHDLNTGELIRSVEFQTPVTDLVIHRGSILVALFDGIINRYSKGLILENFIYGAGKNYLLRIAVDNDNKLYSSNKNGLVERIPLTDCLYSCQVQNCKSIFSLLSDLEFHASEKHVYCRMESNTKIYFCAWLGCCYETKKRMELENHLLNHVENLVNVPN